MASISADDIYLMFTAIISWFGSLWTIMRSFEIAGLNWLELSVLLLVLGLIAGVINYILHRGADLLIDTGLQRSGASASYYMKDTSARFSNWRDSRKRAAAERNKPVRFHGSQSGGMSRDYSNVPFGNRLQKSGRSVKSVYQGYKGKRRRRLW